jgi:WD40 repeat protein
MRSDYQELWRINRFREPDAKRSSGRACASGQSARGLRLDDLVSTQVIRVLEEGLFESQHVTVTPDGHRAVSAGRDGTLRLWGIESGECIRRFEGHANVVHGLSVTPNGRRVVSAGSDGTLRVWNLNSGTCEAVFCGPGQFRSVALAPTHNRVVAGTSTNEVVFYDVRGIAL